MAQSGNFTPILLYASSTPTNVPSAGNLTNSATGSELAINIADKNLFFKDSGGTVNTVPIRQSNTSSDGWLSYTDWNTFNGKAPAVTYTTNYVPYGQGTTTLNQSSGLQFDGTTFTTTGISTTNNLTFTGTAARIRGDFSNGTIGNRTLFQTTTTNASTQIGLIPNGTATQSNVVLINDSAAANYSGLNIRQNATTASFIGLSGGAGGSYTPFVFEVGGSERLRFFTSGGVSIGNTVDKGAASLNLSGLIFPQQATTAGAPAYQKGAIYFDTTLNKLRVGGATAWETITSV
jgi:hypothetical protein